MLWVKPTDGRAMLDVSIDMAGFDRYADDLGKVALQQMPFALAKTVTQVAYQAKAALETEMTKAFDRPTPFTMRAFAVQAARKSQPNPEAVVFAKDIQAEYLAKQIFGGTRQPKSGGRAVLTPAGQRLNKYGNLPRGAVKRALARGNTFSGTVTFKKGGPVAGIWQRPKRRGGQNRGRLKLLVLFEDEKQVKPRFDFADIVIRVANEQALLEHFRLNLRDAVATARR
ncbi:hypothetical protein [Pyruvatibacter sp.]